MALIQDAPIFDTSHCLGPFPLLPTVHPCSGGRPTYTRMASVLSHPQRWALPALLTQLSCAPQSLPMSNGPPDAPCWQGPISMTFRKCPLQSEESSGHPAMTSMTRREPAELFTNPRVSHVPVHHCLPTLCLLLVLGPSVCYQNMSRSALTNDSPVKAGEHRLRLTSLFSTPTPIFSSAQKVPTDLSVKTTGYVRCKSGQRYTKCSSRVSYLLTEATRQR